MVGAITRDLFFSQRSFVLSHPQKNIMGFFSSPSPPVAPTLALPVTSLYVGLLGAGLVALTVRVIKTRRANKVPWGDGGITELKRVVRAHANFTE